MHPLRDWKMETYLFAPQLQTMFVAQIHWSNCQSMNSLQSIKWYLLLINYCLKSPISSKPRTH
jgi:hypothetical protein